MGMRNDEAWMYPTGHGSGCQCPNCVTYKQNEWYAANDTRIGGSSNQNSGNSAGRGDTCSQEAIDEARRLGYDDRLP
jgi:hypothetical protein